MRLFEKKICNDCKLFQSTHSLRSATRGRKNSFLPCWFQSTHSLRSATKSAFKIFLVFVRFNPRTPCGVRQCSRSTSNREIKFQSTHSLRSATLPEFSHIEELKSFNPRTPCGVRLWRRRHCYALPEFQSTHSLRSATDTRPRPSRLYKVSIHALLAECDGANFHVAEAERCFNPRTPCGVRLFPEGGAFL